MKGSLTATTLTPFSTAARSTNRPIRPKPLIPTFAILGLNMEKTLENEKFENENVLSQWVHATTTESGLRELLML